MKKVFFIMMVMSVGSINAMQVDYDLESGVPGRIISDLRSPIIHSSNAYISQMEQRFVINTITVNNHTMNVQQHAHPMHIVPLEYDRTVCKIAAVCFAIGTISGLSIGMHHCN